MSKRVLLIIGGGIAAYKSLELIRRLKEAGVAVRVVMTEAAQRFVTPLAAGAIVGERVFTDLFDQAQEFDVGHIRLARECDLIVVAPATADLMAKAAHGLANDLASAVLLATDKPVLLAPAMNPHMWAHAATQRNFAKLQADGLRFVGPNEGEMAERGERGVGRMAEPDEIRDAVLALLKDGPLKGKRVLVTAGPTNLPTPAGVTRVDVESAREMLKASEAALPLDVAVMVAAVADWRPTKASTAKIKKDKAGAPAIALQENPDILATLSKPGKKRPKLVIGFAAETDNVEEHARAKIAKKGCDWIVANDVSGDVMGGAENQVLLITKTSAGPWPRMAKEAVARKLAGEIAKALGSKQRQRK
jgi:phosphopantothenoylcysteine decarboxylase/phosphopantothenate--cysteine ligase